MRYRFLGRTGLRVSELFLGAMTFGEQCGVGAPREECARMPDAYAAAGGNVIDTAVNYRGGESERLVGLAVRSTAASLRNAPGALSTSSGTTAKSPTTRASPVLAPAAGRVVAGQA